MAIPAGPSLWPRSDGQVRSDEHRQQAEHAPHQAVDDPEQHPEMVPATPLILQQTPVHNTRPSFRAGHGTRGDDQVHLTELSATRFPAPTGFWDCRGPIAVWDK